MLDVIISLQPRTGGGGGGKTSDELVAEAAADMVGQHAQAAQRKGRERADLLQARGRQHEPARHLPHARDAPSSTRCSPS